MKSTASLIDDQFTAEARRLLEVGRRHPRDGSRVNPVTGMGFVHGLDPLVWQIRDAARALRARDRFARENPDLPPLPLGPHEWEGGKSGPGAFHIKYALGLFARSLGCNDPYRFDLDRHPTFEVYMRGFMCSPRLREMFQAIAPQVPPQPLIGLVPGGSFWGPPTRRSYLAELARTHDRPEMPEWPSAWLLPEQRHVAKALAKGRAMKEPTL